MHQSVLESKLLKVSLNQCEFHIDSVLFLWFLVKKGQTDLTKVKEVHLKMNGQWEGHPLETVRNGYGLVSEGFN